MAKTKRQNRWCVIGSAGSVIVSDCSMHEAETKVINDRRAGHFCEAVEKTPTTLRHWGLCLQGPKGNKT